MDKWMVDGGMGVDGYMGGGVNVPLSQHGGLGWLSEARQEEREKEVMSLIWKPKRKGN